MWWTSFVHVYGEVQIRRSGTLTQGRSNQGRIMGGVSGRSEINVSVGVLGVHEGQAKVIGV